jgi:hypothetical protein
MKGKIVWRVLVVVGVLVLAGAGYQLYTAVERVQAFKREHEAGKAQATADVAAAVASGSPQAVDALLERQWSPDPIPPYGDRSRHWWGGYQVVLMDNERRLAEAKAGSGR